MNTFPRTVTLPRFLTLYVRGVMLFMVALTGLMLIVAGTRAALAAELRTEAILNGVTLTAGDIFGGIPAEKASHVLGPAPKPGQDMVLNATTLLRVALALNIPWHPTSSADQIVIRRAATIIDEDDIREAITVPLGEQGVEGRYDIVFHRGTKPELILPQDLPPTFDIVGFRYDPSRDWFQATVMAPSKDNALAQVAIAGRIQRIVQVPALKSALRNGDVIGARDIVWLDMYAQDLKPHMVSRAEDLIGRTPRRVSEAGRPLRDIEFEYPALVGRGDTVTIIYKTPLMTLTARGKSLQGGAKGDAVQLVNVNSNRTLEGVVSGTREITVIQ